MQSQISYEYSFRILKMRVIMAIVIVVFKKSYYTAVMEPFRFYEKYNIYLFEHVKRYPEIKHATQYRCIIRSPCKTFLSYMQTQGITGD